MKIDATSRVSGAFAAIKRTAEVSSPSHSARRASPPEPGGALEGADQPAARHLPDLDDPVRVGGRNEPGVLVEGKGADVALCDIAPLSPAL